MSGPSCYALKVDVCTYEGLRDGVVPMLEAFARFDVRATFFVALGPDNSGKAVWNLFRQKGFLEKMIRTSAPAMYGWRTLVSGTLLPARMIGARQPDLIRRIDAEGHEVALHGWDHRLWQDHVDELDVDRVRDHFARARDAFESIVGRPPRASGAPAWIHSPQSLAVQDDLGLDYASDLRGGAPGYPVLEGYTSSTLQIPSTQPCLEELLTLGERDLTRCAELLIAPGEAENAIVVPLHAEVEGRSYIRFLERVLEGIRECATPVKTMGALASEIGASGTAKTFRARRAALPGRGGIAFVPEEADPGRSPGVEPTTQAYPRQVSERTEGPRHDG